MIYVETALLTILAILCAVTSVTDIRSGIVANRHLLYACVPVLLLDAIYYFFFVRMFLRSFLLNLAVMTLITLLFYAYRIWSAGDSKLLLMVTLCIPARICYAARQGTLAPTIQVIILIFSFAYIYVVFESVIIGLKRRDLFQIRAGWSHIMDFLKQYVLCGIYIALINELLVIAPLENFYRNNTALVMIINLIVIMSVLHIKIFSQKYIWALCLLSALLMGYFTNPEIMEPERMRQIFQGRFWLLSIAVIFLRMIAEKYNYRTIPVDKVKAGMVLALSSVLLFKPSRIRGLPEATTEDIRSRLTPQEAESIRRWKDSRYGKSEIVIVSKMPFAIFISMGTIVFVVVQIGFHGN
jgi:hypothetical protein